MSVNRLSEMALAFGGVHMSQRQAIGIDDPIAARDRLKSPWAREAALRHPTSISGAGGGGLSGCGPGASRKAVGGQGGHRGDCHFLRSVSRVQLLP